MANTGRLSHRDRAQRQLDLDFLIRAMYEKPGLSIRQYHELLKEDIAQRGITVYEITTAQVGRDISDIRQNVVANSGLNLKSQVLDSLKTLEYLKSVTLDQLERAINEEVVSKTVIIDDLQVKDFDGLSDDEKILFAKLKGKVKRTKQRIKTMPAGSGIKDFVLTVAKINDRIDILLGLRAAKKVDTRNVHVHSFENMTSQEFVDKCKILGITTKKKLSEFIETIEFTDLKKQA